ncbi:hypothetical protein GCM10025859_18990 [Alicyclobacillus fastidiosus]|nr:hypothetical protein GCM10025859_18990 [Alicyclobacillus fastidiosus]
MPNEPPESNFKDKVTTRAYPCWEVGGVVWTYMGPRDGFHLIRITSGCAPQGRIASCLKN